MTSTLLWKDVPSEKRITEEFLRGRMGAANGTYGEKWVQRILQLMSNPKCHMAVPWYQTGLFRPCGMTPSKTKGNKDFCHYHQTPPKFPKLRKLISNGFKHGRVI